MPIQGVSNLGPTMVSQFFSAAQARITNEVAERSDAALPETETVSRVESSSASSSASFSGSLVDLRV